VNSETKLPEFFERNKLVKNKTNLLTRISFLTLTSLLGSFIALAQTAPQNLSGTYEATVKPPNSNEVKVTLELKSESGKISGRVSRGVSAAEINEAKLENGTLTLSFGNQKMIVAKVDGEKLVGEAVDGTEKIPIEFKKVTPAPAAATATPADASAAVNLNGNWEAVADANGQPFPFALTLKIDGETVTGGSSSQLGEAPIKSGSWKGGKLVFELEGQNGTISMSATVIDGKLSGEFDFSGQLQGKWVAVKKN
jgi:hypothetical protein